MKQMKDNFSDTDDQKQSNTYLTFTLGEELFAVNIEKAVSIIEVQKYTKVPRSPDYMKGVVNIRGKVLPIIDTRMKFGMSPIAETKTTVIIVFYVKIDGEYDEIGALVDEPGTIIELNEDQISDAPSIGAKYKSELIKGTFKHNDKFALLINIDKVFSLDELLEIHEINKNPEIEENKQEN